MGQYAEHVYTRPQDIAGLSAATELLPDQARVVVTMRDGVVIEGVVATRPILQSFHGPDGEEGINSVVRLDDAIEPGKAHYLWLDRILDVRHLGTD